MRRAGWVCMFAAALSVMLPVVVLGIFAAGGSGQPLPVPATEEKAYEYQFVCTELGAPWDVAMLSDAVRAYAEGEDIEQYNPIITGLEFCRLREERYILVEHENDDGTTEAEWVADGVAYYDAADAILEYAGQDRLTLGYRDAAQFITSLQERAAAKGGEEVRYTVALENYTEAEYPDVLDAYIGLEEADRKGVVDLYEARYLPQLYGFDEYVPTDAVWSGNAGGMPDVTVGDVTRQELLEVAASLLNWPYLLGGKSARCGAPSGPLDCSGYVDWVYYQCFGQTVAGGGGTTSQWYASDEISASALRPGDLGFLRHPSQVGNGVYNHVGIYIGEIGGQRAWIHCGGSAYGYADRPLGRVGISVESGSNVSNPILGGTFAPAMKGCRFRYYRRPHFTFAGEEAEDEQTA